jgi:membrane-bound ClpP family serine protease
MNYVKNIYEGWRTTFIGLMMLVLSGFYIFTPNHNVWVLLVLIIVGISLIFSRDLVISTTAQALKSLKRVMKNNEDKKL